MYCCALPRERRSVLGNSSFFAAPLFVVFGMKHLRRPSVKGSRSSTQTIELEKPFDSRVEFTAVDRVQRAQYGLQRAS